MLATLIYYAIYITLLFHLFAQVIVVLLMKAMLQIETYLKQIHQAVPWGINCVTYLPLLVAHTWNKFCMSSLKFANKMLGPSFFREVVRELDKNQEDTGDQEVELVRNKKNTAASQQNGVARLQTKTLRRNIEG